MIGRLVGGPGHLLLHRRRIAFIEGDDITAKVEVRAIESASASLVESGFGLIQAIQVDIGEEEIAVSEVVVGVEAPSVGQFGNGLVQLAE